MEKAGWSLRKSRACWIGPALVPLVLFFPSCGVKNAVAPNADGLEAVAVVDAGTTEEVAWSQVFDSMDVPPDKHDPGWQPEPTVGLLVNEAGAFPGYTLFAPLSSTTTYLVDGEGQLVHWWDSAFRPGNSVYLLENGNLLRTGTVGGPDQKKVFDAGGAGGRVQEIAWDGTVVWDFEYAGDTFLQHHDVERMPDGNVLIVAWELKSADEAVAAGRNPNLLPDDRLWPDHVIEVQSSGPNGTEIVWEWHAWDHLVQDFDPSKANYGTVADNPGLIDLNFVSGKKGKADWNHCNSVDYDPELDQIILSVHAFDEIWIIDHGTTTQEAAGHAGGRQGKGGDLLYRWGNPEAHGAGDAGDRQLYAQHDARWIETGLPGAGNVLVFNNGMGRPEGEWSSVIEIETPAGADGAYTIGPGGIFGPAGPDWTYMADPPTDFYSHNISGAQRLENGNTLICEGATGTFFEVTAEGIVVWKYINPVTKGGILAQREEPGNGDSGSENSVFRAERYGLDHPGLVGRDLTPKGTIEL